MTTPLSSGPEQWPAPENDGRADHLPGLELPIVPLPATDGRRVDLSALSGRAVVYVYPRTAVPGEALPDGWESIPGAPGCTSQACGFRDAFAALRELGFEHVFGLSVQHTDEQKEAAERLGLPFPLLSDATREFSRAIDLPCFTAAGHELLKRITLIVDEGAISHVFYPVFPPDQSARQVLEHFQALAAAAAEEGDEEDR